MKKKKERESEKIRGDKTYNNLIENLNKNVTDEEIKQRLKQ